MLGPGGPLATRLAGYEHREGQLSMADAVERALADASVLVCEAGTGTGKTLAYLVPALMSGQRVVVSTATKALQEQIVHKDVPLVQELCGIDTPVVLAKGLSNYLCLRRFDELRKSVAPGAHPRALPVVEAWAQTTQTGDIAEVSEVAEGDPIWREITSSSETRLGSRCSRFDACFVTRMKRELSSARVIVVNHHLLFADLALRALATDRAVRAGVLPPYDAVILDEAHRVEDVASEFFGLRVSSAKLAALSRDAERSFRLAGLYDPLLCRAGVAGLLGELEAAAARFFDAACRAPPGPAPEGRVLLDRSALEGLRTEPYLRLDTALEALSAFAETHAATEAVSAVARRAADVREELSGVVDPGAGHVAWLEIRARTVVLGAAMVSVGDALRDILFSRTGGAVLTSATLTSVPVPAARSEEGPSVAPSGPFSFLRQRVGLDRDLGAPVEELDVGSPFDHDAAAVLYVPRDLPDPGEEAWSDAAVERAAELVDLTGGGAFVLTTSARSMRAFGASVGRRTGRTTLVQGEAPKSALVSRFREHGDAVLVGTMSFWEGVDVPGSALRLVVIDKLPFAVPADAIVSSRCAALAALGVDPFYGFVVPAATIILKQGIGRLLRTREDRGIVAVLDRRLVTRGYGKKMLQKLPILRRVERWEEVVEAARGLALGGPAAVLSPEASP